MTWTLPDLDDETRRRMLSEFESDVATGVVLQSKVVHLSASGDYLDAHRDAFSSGDPDAMAAEILASGMLLDNQANGNRVNKLDAAARLGGGQFGAYYLRGVASRAIEENREVEVYRARASANPRPGSDAKVGQRIPPQDLLNDLRTNSSTANFSILPEVRSGLLVRLI